MRKFLMYKLSAAQAEVAHIKGLVEKLDAGGAEASGDLASGPANGAAAKVLAAKKAAAAKAKAEAEEAAALEAAGEEGGEALGVGTEEEEGGEALDAGSDGPSEDDVKAGIKKLANKCGKEIIGVLLKKYKSAAIQDIKEKDYVKVLADIEATIKKAKK